mgnify:CR=1 FL=1
MSVNIHQNIIDKLEYFISVSKIPNIIFHGASGSGKRTILNNFIKNIYKNNNELMKKYVLFVNCAHGKGISFIRDELKFFAKTNIHKTGDLIKSIILLNADMLTTDAQSALRRCIEKPGIKKEVGLTSLEVVNEQTLVLTMERIGDLAKRVSREDSRAKLSSSEIKELNGLYDKITENYNNAINAYQKKDYDISRKVYSENKLIQKSCDKSKDKIKSPNAFKVLNLIREMSNNISLIGEVGIMNSQSTLTNVSFE